MNEKTLKYLKSVITGLLSLGIFILATQTCPTKKAHEVKVTESIKKEVKRQAILGLSQDVESPFLLWLIEKASGVVANKAASFTKKMMSVDDFWVVSVGSVSAPNGFHLVSIGAFDHVFVFPMYVDFAARSIIEELK